MTLLEKFIELERTLYPGAAFKFKTDSRLHRAIGFLVRPFNKKYLTNYTTVVHPVTWFGDEWRGDSKDMKMLQTEFHENVHKYDQHRGGLLWTVRYLYPQILAIPALLLFLFSWYGAVAYALVLFLISRPNLFRAVWRRDAEVRGYTASLYQQYLLTGCVDDGTIDFYVSQFTGSNYLWMDTRAEAVRREFLYQIERFTKNQDAFLAAWRWERDRYIQSPYAEDHQAAIPFRMMKQFIEAEGLSHAI